LKVTGLSGAQNIEVKINNMTGAEVNRQIFSAQDNNDWMELRDIPQGFYTLTVSSSENRWVRKVMVK